MTDLGSHKGVSVYIAVYRLLCSGIVLQLIVMLAMAQISPSYAAAAVADSKQPDTAAPAPLNWGSLELKNTGMATAVTTRIELKTLSAVAVQSALIDAPKPMLQRVAAARIQALLVANSIRLLLGVGIETETQLWFNTDDGLPLQLNRSRRGRKPSQKLYRFGNRQVYRLRRQPADKIESGQPAGQWSEISESFYPLPDAGCPLVLESSQLLYLLSSPDYALGESTAEVCVFDRQRVYKVGFQLLGREPLDVDYLQVTANEETWVKRPLYALRVALTSRPLEDSQVEVQPFSFLGLDDEIQLLLSDPGRIPLRVTGQVSGFGKIDLELKKLTR